MSRVFNGTTDRIDYADPGISLNGGQAFNVSAWLYRTGTGRGYVVCLHTSGGDVATVLEMNNTNAGDLVVFQGNTAGGLYNHRRTVGNTVPLNAWTHVVAWHNGSGTSGSTCYNIIINGADASYAAAGNATGTARVSGGTLSLGGRLSDNLRNFAGRMADVAFWNANVMAPAANYGPLYMLSSQVSPLATPDGFVPSLKFYAPLIGDAHSWLSGAATLDGTTVGDHPRIFMPSTRKRMAFAPTSAPPTSFVPGAVHHRKQQRAA